MNECDAAQPPESSRAEPRRAEKRLIILIKIGDENFQNQSTWLIVVARGGLAKGELACARRVRAQTTSPTGGSNRTIRTRSFGCCYCAADEPENQLGLARARFNWL